MVIGFPILKIALARWPLVKIWYTMSERNEPFLHNHIESFRGQVSNPKVSKSSTDRKYIKGYSHNKAPRLYFGVHFWFAEKFQK